MTHCSGPTSTCECPFHDYARRAGEAFADRFEFADLFDEDEYDPPMADDAPMVEVETDRLERMLRWIPRDALVNMALQSSGDLRAVISAEIDARDAGAERLVDEAVDGLAPLDRSEYDDLIQRQRSEIRQRGYKERHPD